MLNICRDNRGTLLMNIVVVCGIIAMMTAIAIPFLKRYEPNLKLNSNAREIASNLRLAQQLTITEQVTHLIFFNTTNHSYSLLRLPAPNATSTLATIFLDSEVGFQSVTGLTDNLVRFNSYGAVSEGGDVNLINSNGKTVSVFIKPSGYVQLSN